ncbi:bifunctional P-450:NADPH-P450 reductase [Periconia macrospinosa]|uniref:Bifunctional cytochrome P450/NADPH--P450 reductase n=1 Tax=Periconia macrospinosa TaxID=97972 RepID=A0A2V1DIP7_9PLEO|nr:bifunctional P-450:NADPH-P450 reductase [Periconia macrospinosa]
MASKTEPIPQPPKAPIVGNLGDIDVKFPLDSMVNLTNKYGPIFKLNLPGLELVAVSDWSMVNEVCDDSRFRKSIKGDLEELRNAVNDGLFTSSGEDEENWGVAHRVLMSAFGPLSIRNMFDEMHEVASQLALKWARQGPDEPLDVAGDMTRLALDTVALCSMGFRFNSYYRQDLHPFIVAMNKVLDEAGRRANRFMPSVFHHSSNRKFKENIKLLRKTAREVIDSRKSVDGPSERKDLLHAMLSGVDPKTGRKMSEESIIDNLITFLVAGHETTAGTLTFVLYNLVKYPEICRKAQQEVDTIVGRGAVTLEHVPKLEYLSALIRETMRLNAPITAFAREAVGDQIIGGKYLVKNETQIVCFLTRSQSDPVVWGPDAHEFKPERMLNENFERMQKKYPHCWAPFGTGLRACIGRPFAWQEMILALAVLLQNFNFAMHNPSYTLQIAQSLTIRPKDLYVRAISREGLTPAQLEARLAGGYTDTEKTSSPAAELQSNGTAAISTGRKIAIFYGSNSGTCEFMAQKLASGASAHGYVASVDILDAAKEQLPRDIPVVLITASYEGQPTQNASHFVNWVENMKSEELGGVKYAVWGCGHGDWVNTYQKIPILIDKNLQKLGGTRIVPLGTTDAKDRDMFSDFETWEDQKLWPAIKQQFGSSESAEASLPALELSFSSPRSSNLRQDVKESLIVDARRLTTTAGVGEKRHLELQLPSGWNYAAGDYLAVLPHNPKETVGRVMRRFHLAWDAHVTIQSPHPTTLPTNVSLPVSEVLSSYVELNQVATKRNITALSQFAEDDEVKAKLQLLSTDRFEDEVRSKFLSVLGILEQYPALRIPFDSFLSILPPMRVRQYSISSSPLANEGKLTLTYSVLDAPAHSGVGRHVGVASSYLSSLLPGDKIQVSVRPAAGGFRLPPEPAKTPIICIAAGTGLAPFRAFVQERAMIAAQQQQQQGGAKLAPALLFYGCRDPADDDLYRDEFDAWERAGIVTVYRAYSRRLDAAEGCRYVQDRLWRERESVVALWSEGGARIYLCGSSKIAKEAKEVLIRIAQGESERRGEKMTDEEAVEWFESQRNERFATDVFD